MAPLGHLKAKRSDHFQLRSLYVEEVIPGKMTPEDEPDLYNMYCIQQFTLKFMLSYIIKDPQKPKRTSS